MAHRKYFFERVSRNYRLLLSLVIATVVYLIVRQQPPALAFVLVCLGFSVSFLIFSWIVMLASHPRGLKNIVGQQDTNITLMFVFVVAAAFASLVAVVNLLQLAPDASRSQLFKYLALAITAVVSSWTLIHTLFTLHYAHLYYTYASEDAHASGDPAGGLQFPGTSLPDYLDFAYFSFVLGMTFQVSDVQILNSRLRRLALLHGLLSFAFNTIIIALAINIVSGVVEPRSHGDTVRQPTDVAVPL